MEGPLTVVGHYPRVFKEWGITVTLIKTEDNSIYVPVRHLCEEIGIDARRQLVNLNADPQYAEGLKELPVHTAGGSQKNDLYPKAGTGMVAGESG